MRRALEVKSEVFGLSVYPQSEISIKVHKNKRTCRDTSQRYQVASCLRARAAAGLVLAPSVAAQSLRVGLTH